MAGYLHIFDLRQRKFIFGEKVHMQGIEGLLWAGPSIYTCSSDMLISVVKPPPAKPLDASEPKL